MADDQRTPEVELLDEFRSWMAAAGDPYPDDTVANAAAFAEWRRTHATERLDAVNEDDVVDFLLDWCARRMTINAEESTVLCASIGSFLEFLGDTGRLAGGSPRGAGLSHLAMSLAGAVHTTSTNPESPSKDILTHPGFNPPGKPRYIELLAQPNPMSEDELEAELRSRMAKFKALPDEQQVAALDRVFDEESEPIELPFLYIPPPAADVESVAAQVPMLAKIDALRNYLGESGKPLTERGNIKLADGKALIELLDTGDEFESEFVDHTYRKNTTERLPGLNSIVNIAKEAGAVRIHQHKLVPVKTWSRRSATERAAAVYCAIIELGALGSRGSSYELISTVDDVLDDGTVHWLAGLLDPDLAADFDRIVDAVEPVLRGEIEPSWPQWSESLEGMAQRGISEIVETLEAAGVVEWIGRGQTKFGSGTIPTGGRIRLTALGRHVVPDSLADEGYALKRVDDLADAPALRLVDVLDSVPDDQRQAVVDTWQPGRAARDRVGQIVDVIASGDAALRLRGFAALELFDDATVEPAARELLDGPAAGQAALYLMSRGLADEAELGHLVDIGVFVDVLAASLDNPEELCEMFAEAPQAADQYNALEQMVRHPAPETELVLDALGAHLTDKKLAKAARKAAMRHRSWMANRT